jgi:hypothetical protein
MNVEFNSGDEWNEQGKDTEIAAHKCDQHFGR